MLACLYNREAFSSPGKGSWDRIVHVANSLLAELYADRQLADAFKRPVILVFPGIGDLLLKRAFAFSLYTTRIGPTTSLLGGRSTLV